MCTKLNSPLLLSSAHDLSTASLKSIRNVDVRGKVRGEMESSNERVEWTLGVKTFKPKISIKLLSSVCNDNELCLHDEHEGDSGNNCGLDTVYAKVEASQKDIQHRKDKGTAAAQTQMPSTKPKARTSVTSSQLIDGNEVASLRDQSHPSFRTPMGKVNMAASHPRTTSSAHASITLFQGKTSAALQEAAITQPRLSNISREEAKRQYYKDLCRQVEERNQQRERERRRNDIDEHKHNETMQRSIWGMPGGGAPNYNLGTVKRTKNLYAAGILPQEQIRDKGFSGIPFRSV